MLDLDQVLVVDGSPFVRNLISRLMRRHSRETHAVGHCDEARAWIASHPDGSLVICDLDTPGGGALGLLEWSAGLEGRRPRIVVMGRRFDARLGARALELGAIGCLGKPVSFGDIARAVAASRPRPFTLAAPRCYARPPARAHLLDPGESEQQMAWNVHDLSVSGALLDTRGPIPVGTPLRVALSVGRERLRLECQVVRVQEPAWEAPAGVGVRFLDLTPHQRTALEREIRRLGARER